MPAKSESLEIAVELAEHAAADELNRIPRTWDRPFPVSGVPVSLRIPYSVNGPILQRLFSTFACGWPGVGLLLLRLLTGVVLIYFGIVSLLEATPLPTLVPQIIGAGAGILLLFGVWTPMAGTLTAIMKLWTAFSRIVSNSGNPWMAFMEAVLGAVLAMVGPGAWSVDARLYGRKRIDIRERQ
jgi:putative oxidoreductase